MVLQDRPPLVEWYILWTQTITLKGGTVNNVPQKIWDQTHEITPQRLLAEWSLAKLSLAELSLAELSLTQSTEYDW